MNSDPTQIPLWSNDAECAVISCVVNHGTTALDLALDLVHEDWFYVPVNKTAWLTLKEMGARRQPIDLTTFTEALRQAGHLQKIEGGPGYVAAEWTRTTGILSTLEHAVHEGLVDLQRVERQELAQVHERGVADAEVVDGELHAEA